MNQDERFILDHLPTLTVEEEKKYNEQLDTLYRRYKVSIDDRIAIGRLERKLA
jgi:adenylate cyclase